MSSVYLAISAGISEMRVQIGEQVFTCYVIPHLLPGVVYVSPEIADHIKATHIPVHDRGPMKDVWQPHVPKHVHVEEQDTPPSNAKRGQRIWCGTLSKLARRGLEEKTP